MAVVGVVVFVVVVVVVVLIVVVVCGPGRLHMSVVQQY